MYLILYVFTDRHWYSLKSILLVPTIAFNFFNFLKEIERLKSTLKQKDSSLTKLETLANIKVSKDFIPNSQL